MKEFLKWIWITGFLIPGLKLSAQDFFMGDSNRIGSVEKQMAAIYESKDSTLFFLRRKGFQKISSSGTRIDVYMKNKEINRMVTLAATPNGTLGVEYWIHDNELIFAYQSFECYDESASQYRWKNWKGLHGWESRYYFINEKAVYEKHSGFTRKNRLYLAVDLVAEKNKILNYVLNKLKTR